ncbi:MAG: hypothetical protein GWO24_07075, partial [Akkermansiaceae bacterium]|nr:hypothetical protein [Akkermansiaceae bacterium]
FPCTTLSLAGLEVPSYMQGRAFLGPDPGERRRFVYGCRDRVDEMFEMARSVRSARYLYIRNYHPYLSYNQPSVFPDLGAIRREITRVAAENLEALTPDQRDYAGPAKPVEAFYDCEADPGNLRNLIGTGMNAQQLIELNEHRAAFAARRMALLDSGPIPESEMWKWIRNEGKPLRDILEGKTNHQPDLARAWAAADLVGTDRVEEMLELLKSGDPNQRYWAIIGLRQAGFDEKEKVIDHLDDVAPAVRIETAGWLARDENYREAALTRLVAELGHRDWWTALRACRAIELLGQDGRAALPAMRKLYDATRNEKGDGPFYLAFSSGAFLEQFGEPTKPWDFAPGAGAFTPEPEKKQDRDRARIGK